MTYNDCLANSSYLNPALEKYECDGQMSIFDFINETSNQNYINKKNASMGSTNALKEHVAV